MSTPSIELNNDLYISSKFELYEKLAQACDIGTVKSIFDKYLTPCELLLLKRRFFIEKLLDESKSVREIAKVAKCSTQTVMAVKKIRETVRRKKKNENKAGQSTKFIIGQAYEN